jgi:hypothetical protein
MSVKKATAGFLIFLSVLTGTLSLFPGNNGDLPFYIASVLTSEGRTDVQALAETKTLIHSEMSGPKAELLVHLIDSSAPDILEYYRIKPLYISIIRTLHTFGISYILSTRIPSLVSFFLIGVLIFFWAIKILNPSQAFLLSCALLLINPVMILARLSSPDPLSNLFIYYALYRMYFGKKYFFTALILIGSLFIRLDNFIAVSVLLAVMLCWPEKGKKMPLWTGIGFVFLALLTPVAINYFAETEFWWVKKFTYLQSFSAYGYQVLIYMGSMSWSFLPFLLLFGLIAQFIRSKKFTERAYFILIPVAGIIFLRFLFFPSLEDRFMAAYYLTSFLILVEMMLPQKKANIRRGEENRLNPKGKPLFWRF